MRITNIKNVLLALRNTYGSHKASELRHNLLAAARDYKHSDTIAIFMPDHASTQNTASNYLYPSSIFGQGSSAYVVQATSST